MKIRPLLFALVIAGIPLISLSHPASAGPGIPGHWHGSPDPDACNEFDDCIYIFKVCYNEHTQTVGTYTDNPAQPQALATVIGATLGSCPIFHSGYCKLVEIDTTIKLGSSHPFNARWRGSIASLRFRSDEGMVFISPLADSIHFENGARAGLFSIADDSGAALLPPGIYKVSCFGSSGMAGEEIKVTVVR